MRKYFVVEVFADDAYDKRTGYVLWDGLDKVAVSQILKEIFPLNFVKEHNILEKVYFSFNKAKVRIGKTFKTEEFECIHTNLYFRFTPILLNQYLACGGLM